MSNTYCSLAFSHLYINTNGSFSPCCRYRISEDNNASEWNDVSTTRISDYDSIEDILRRYPKYENIQNKMLSGEKLLGCTSCYIEEDATGSSMRILENKKWGIAYNKSNIKLKSMEITFGNYCNLACRMCDSRLSTSWYQDEEKLERKYLFKNSKPIERSNVDRKWKTKDFSSIESIKITGGEPLLHPDFVQFLDTIVESGRANDIELSIFTNVSFIPKTYIIDSLSKFKNVNLYLSIDGVGAVHEYIRHNSSWNTTIKSVEKWFKTELEHPSIHICFSPTISLFNIMYIDELIDWWLDKRIEVYGNMGSFETTWNIMSDPVCMSIHDFINAEDRVLELEKYKLDLYKRVGEFPESIDILLNKIIENLHKVSKSNINIARHKEFVQYTKDLDLLRNQSVSQSLPKLYSLYQHLFKKYNGRLKDK